MGLFSFTLKCWNCILGDDGEKIRTKTSACYFKLMIKIIIIINCLVIKIENLCFFHVNKTYLSWDNKILNSQSQDTIKSLWTQTWKRKMLNSSFRFRWLLFCDHIFNVHQLLIFTETRKHSYLTSGSQYLISLRVETIFLIYKSLNVFDILNLC